MSNLTVLRVTSLSCVDTAAIIHNGRVVAQGTPTNLIQNIEAKNAYFGDSFKIV